MGKLLRSMCKRDHSLNHVSILNDNIKTLRPTQNGRLFPDDIFKWVFLNENVWISIKISLKFVPKGPLYNIRSLVQIMAWRRPGDMPLSEPMMIILQTHICVTRPQWVNVLRPKQNGRLFAEDCRIFSNAFSRMKMIVFWLQFYCIFS